MTGDDLSIVCTADESSMANLTSVKPSACQEQFLGRKTAAASNARLRQLIRPWTNLPPMPSGCRAVSASHWTRFTASETSAKTPAEMKASVLWNADALRPEFNPPLLERTYLGADQSVICGKPEANGHARRGFLRKQKTSTSSWVTTRSLDVSQIAPAPITFDKREVKSAPTNSLLTASLRSSPPVPIKRGPLVTADMAKEFGIDVLSTSNLPDTCFSDSEDEESFASPPPAGFKKRALIVIEVDKEYGMDNRYRRAHPQVRNLDFEEYIFQASSPAEIKQEIPMMAMRATRV